MAYTNIDDPSAYFQIALWTGTGSAGNAVTFDGNSDMQPDLVWSKRRDVGYSHVLKNTSMGGASDNDIHLVPDLANAESTYASYRMDFNSDGFTLDGVGDSGFQGSGSSMVSWCWKANGGTTSSNTDGSVTSTVQANTTAGFSIVTYSSDNTSSETIGHGLGAVPKMIIVKRRNSNNRDWAVYHESVGNTKYLQLNESDAEIDNAAYWNDTTPTSSVFTIGTGNNSRVNSSSQVAYCFAEKQGYSKFGKYIGQVDGENGPFVYTGFKPAFVMIKLASATQSWDIHDNKRNTFNPMEKRLLPNSSGAEETRPTSGGSVDCIDFLSNGFKVRSVESILNSNNGIYVYMAFAENPFVTSTGTPTTAR